MRLDPKALKAATADATCAVGEMMRKDPLTPPLDQIMYLAITAYLAAMREQGFAMMPRQPSVEMTDAADVDLGVADVYVITGMRAIAVPKETPQDQVRLFGSARALLWIRMFDAAAGDA